MKTFKQFIAEIDHDDETYSKTASDGAMGFDVDGSWESLTSIDGYPLLWKQVAKEYRVVMIDPGSKKPMFRLALLAKIVKVPGGTLTGVVTDALTSKAEYRGKGLALKIYEALVDHGQVLFSSNLQTSGSRRLWEQLIKNKEKQTFVLAEGAAARWYIRKYGNEEMVAANVLLTGALDRMNDEAYASSETRWVVLPSELEGLNMLQAGAIAIK